MLVFVLVRRDEPQSALLSAVVVLAVGCGGSTLDDGVRADATVDDSGRAMTVCIPGQSVSCVGPGGCLANQVCNSSGDGLGPCSCAPRSDARVVLCIPGKSIACAGAGGCIGSQACNADGSGYDGCACRVDAAASLACIPGQSIACGGPNGCASYQVCDGAGNAYGPCECPDAATLVGDAGPLPDGYAPIPASLGDQGYNAIWAVDPDEVPSVTWLFRPLFTAPDCRVVPPYGESYAVAFQPMTAGPTGTFPACTQSGGHGATPCYEPEILIEGGSYSWEQVPGGQLTLSDFDANGIATGMMNTTEGIVPLVVKKCP